MVLVGASKTLACRGVPRHRQSLNTITTSQNLDSRAPPAPVCRVHYSSCPLCQTIWCGPGSGLDVVLGPEQGHGKDFA